MPAPAVVVVDHYDSYTWNLVHLIGAVTECLPQVVQHDAITTADLDHATHVVLSPGPGHPADPAFFGVGADLIREVEQGRRDHHVLGVCLGMQGLVWALGGQVTQVAPAHGRLSQVHHEAEGLFREIPTPFAAVRYHSLAAVELPSSLHVTARSEDDVVMAVRHRERPLLGVQFHPESVLSEHGVRLVRNFLS